MAATSNQTSSSSFSASSGRWDVFLSFRGEDIRKTFVDHLYTALDRAGIQTFKDDPELRKGEEISSALLNAIEDSRMSIVVFSKNYASSRWCLAELEKILQCKRTNGQTVHPVFYDVDPSDVRHQLGSFAEAIEKHKLRFMDKVEIWRDALTEASNLSGYHLKNDTDGHESKLIQKIVKNVNVLLEVNPKALIVDEYLVGMDSHVEDLYEKISIGSSNLRVIGIHGMGGVGKTTIAKTFYNKYLHIFECSCFLQDVRETSQRHDGPLSLVERLIYELLEKQDLKVDTVERGIIFLKERVRTKKVLIVLDDLDESSQSKLSVSCWNFFGPESRIIITTRDIRMLVEFEKIDEGYMVMPYKVETLDEDESLELFRYHAFRGTIVKDFREILERIVRYTGGLPLAIKVLGSFLFRRTKEEWTSTLEKLQQIPNNKIQTILKISYDTLDFKEKEIFLDIASFFVGMYKEEANDFFPSIGIKILEERCLLTIDRKNKFRMHDLIRDMGREIVREESKEYGKRSRLWCQEEVCHVLKRQKGTKEIEGIRLDITTSVPEYFNAKTFESMPNLRLLQINNIVHLTGSFENSFEELRFLCWTYFPLTCLPPSFHAPKLVSLDMKSSKVNTLWEGIKHLNSLKFLNASHSWKLTTTPDFGGVKMLEELWLRWCSSLVQIHPSIELLKKLVVLDLSYCTKLERLPKQFKNLSSLETLYLTGCSELVGLPTDLGNMKSLRRLVGNGTAIDQLPDSVGHLSRLVYLELVDCKNLRNLPNSICNLSSLKTLFLTGCSELLELPTKLGNMKSLRKLVGSGTAIEQLPDSVGHLSRLTYLILRDCKNLRNLPNNICNLSSLETLYLNGCSKLVGLPAELGNLKSLRRLVGSGTAIEQLPDSVGHLSRLAFLRLRDCKNLRNLPNNICNLSSLETLYLTGCSELVGLPAELGNMKSLRRLVGSGTAIDQLPDSVGHLNRLVYMELVDCKNLRNLPNSICNLSSLETLFLTGCSELLGLPAKLGNMKSLRKLVGSGTAIEQLPDSVGHLSRLTYLILRDCKNLRNLPNNICNLSSLETLYLTGCSELVGLPAELGNMKSLRRLVGSGTAIDQLPDSVGHLSRLVYLELVDCKNLRNLPNSICNLSSLEKLYLTGCSELEGLPAELGNMKSLRRLGGSGTAIEQLPDSVCRLAYLRLRD